MVELFKRSAQEDKLILAEQINRLEKLAAISMESRDSVWVVRRDFACAIARDTLNRILPEGSNTRTLLEKALQGVRGGDLPAESKTLDPVGLEFLKASLQSISWKTVGSEGQSAPVRSVYQDIRDAIPELIYRHPWFKLLMAAIIALVGLLATGTFVFYNITFKLKDAIEARSKEIIGEVESQKQKIAADMAAQREQNSKLNAQLDDLVKQTSATSTRLNQLQVEANQRINDVTAEARQKIIAEVNRRLPTLDEQLDEAQAKAIRAVAAAGTARVQQVTILDGGQAFKDKVKEFDDRSTQSIVRLTEIQDRQAEAAKKLDAIEKRQAVLDRITRMSASDSGNLQSLMAVYFNTAVQTVWIVAGVLALSCFVHVIYFLRWVKRMFS